ncbi:MAG: primosomal protein N' [Ardenticatenaceae bacterium]|nr:primosomal protein N' [Ardenticatenaceae bacterium]
MFAEVVINIEAPLESAFHYHVPRDMARYLRVGHMVEVSFGRRQAQGIIIAFTATAEVEDTKPIISLVDNQPVVEGWQIELARWMSQQYLAPLNGCLRLMLPPGLTRWADISIDLHPQWDGQGRLTPLQAQIVEILKEEGDIRGRKLRPLLPKKDRKKWQTAVNQLAKRNIVRKATVLDPPRIRPRKIRTAELIAGPKQIQQAVGSLGRKSKQADILTYLLHSEDPLPTETQILKETGSKPSHLVRLEEAGLIERIPAKIIQQEGHEGEVESPAAVGLAVPIKEMPAAILSLKQASVYNRILEQLREAAEPVNISDLYAQLNINISHLRKLVKLDLIRFGSEEVWRDPLADRDFTPSEPPMLTHDQARVWGRVKMALLESEIDDPPDPFLIHGVTGSGKTEIYMRAIDHALQEGQTAIVLVPEIALTPQTVRRFAARFPGRVAVIHSRLTDGERYDTWRRARQGLFDIIIGPRSALFVPMQNLGVIVIDEEHDNSYKQTPPVPPPYYHARETSIALAAIIGAIVIMGSATPDVATYHRARGGTYQLLEMPRRVMGHRQRIASQESRLEIISQYTQKQDDPDDALTIPLPPIQVVDMRQELRAGNRSIFSRVLQNAMDQTLERGEQAILFLNRRGSASFVICRDCGHTMKCPRCDLPLTFHRYHALLTCHQCGYQEPQPAECPACASKRIKYFGLGTEALSEQVQQRWPNANLTRWDRDTTAGRGTHEQLLSAFINQEADVLIGTQMIAKGLDLPLVTLVGVISADVALGLPDYNTGERTFQLMTQVAGRAGRGLLGGRVVFQTYQPEHYAIQAAAEHDYTMFYLDEIRFRTQHGLPPFRRLAKLLFVHHNNIWAEEQANAVAADLRWHALELGLSSTEILGPQPPFFGRVDGRYRWQIVIRSPDPLNLLKDFPIPRNWIVDINPVSML